MKLIEMAVKQICDKCGKSKAGNHWWKKGEGWKCSDKMGTKPRKPRPEAEEEKKEVKVDPKDRTSKDYVPKDANEKAAFDRSVKLRDELERDIAKREAAKDKK